MTTDDRVGPLLRAQPLGRDETDAIDVELWHPGDQERIRRVIDDIRSALPENARVLDQYVGRSVCLLRVRLDATSLAALLEVDWVKEADRRPEPAYETLDLETIRVDELAIGEIEAEDAIGVVIVDLGIRSGHPILRPIVASMTVYVEGVDEANPPGHGTWVAGIAGYGDVGAAVAARQFGPKVVLHSARIVNDDLHFNPDRLLESQLREIVLDLTDRSPSARVFNLSLGRDRAIYRDGSL